MIVVPANCEPPNNSAKIGYITSIVTKRSFHFSNHFSVLGRMLAAKAKGARKTKTVIIAWRAARIIIATPAETITPIKLTSSSSTVAPRPPAAKKVTVPQTTTPVPPRIPAVRAFQAEPFIDISTTLSTF